MKRAAVLIACLLAACGQQRVAVDAPATEAARLHAWKAQCREGRHTAAFCQQVAAADLRRFLSGRTGPDEYQTLADLPPIPPSFDAPADGPPQDDTP